MENRRKSERRSSVKRRGDDKDRRVKNETGYSVEKRVSVSDRRVRLRRLHHRREGWISV